MLVIRRTSLTTLQASVGRDDSLEVQDASWAFQGPPVCLFGLYNGHLLLQVKIKLTCGCEIANEMQSHGQFKIKHVSILEEGKPVASFAKEGFCNDSVYVEISDETLTRSTWLTSGVLWVHTGPALSHNRSAPPPTVFNPAPSTSGNPHTLRVCLIYLFILFAVNLSSAPSKPTCLQDALSARLTYHRARTQRECECMFLLEPRKTNTQPESMCARSGQHKTDLMH